MGLSFADRRAIREARSARAMAEYPWVHPQLLAGAILATHCAKGHAFTALNTRIDWNGDQVCRRCRKAKDKAQRARVKLRKAA